MNTQQQVDPLEQVIRDAGQGWLIDWYAPRESALPALRAILAEAQAAATHRLGGNAPKLTADALVANYKRYPTKVNAFLQVLGSVGTPDILVMVWRILQGMEIAEMQVSYRAQQQFSLRIRLSSPYDGADDEVYESSDIDDAVVLRHLGTTKMGGAPILDGFYPLNLP